MKNFSITFEQNISENSCKKIIESIFAANKIFQDFFQVEFLDTKFYVASSHENLCKAIDVNRPKYGVTTNMEDTIYLYDPSIWTDEETGHTPKDLTESLIHQMVHILFRRNELKSPIWFEEGVAVFVGAELSKEKRYLEFNKLKSQYGFISLENNNIPFGKHESPAYSYLLSYMYIKMLNEKFGQKKLINLIFSLKDENNFPEKLNFHMGINLSDSWELLKKYE